MGVTRKIVAATGFHNSMLTHVAWALESLGYQLLFPGQDLDVSVFEANGQVLYDDYRENIEVYRINEEMIRGAGMQWHSIDARCVREFIDPKPLLDMFDPNQPIALVDPRLAITLEAYLPYLTHALYVGTQEPDRIVRELQQNWGGTFEHWQSQHPIYDLRFEQLCRKRLRTQLAVTYLVDDELADTEAALKAVEKALS